MQRLISLLVVLIAVASTAAATSSLRGDLRRLAMPHDQPVNQPPQCTRRMLLQKIAARVLAMPHHDDGTGFDPCLCVDPTDQSPVATKPEGTDMGHRFLQSVYRALAMPHQDDGSANPRVDSNGCLVASPTDGDVDGAPPKAPEQP